MAFPRAANLAHRWRTAVLTVADGADIDSIPATTGAFPLVQADAAKRPTFRAGALNGFGAVNNSAGKWLTTGTGVPNIVAWTVLLVVQSGDAASNYFLSTGTGNAAIIQGYRPGKWSNWNSPVQDFGDISTTAFQSLCCNVGKMDFDFIKVGSDSLGNDNFVGDWVDLIIWNVALTNAEKTAAIAEADLIYGLSGGGTPPDTTPPTGTITAPTSGQTVSGTVTATADATDNVGISSVQFRINGANYGAADVSLPYSIPIDTTQLANGTHTIWAVLTDTAATPNTFTTTAVSFTVNNASPASKVMRVSWNQTPRTIDYRLKRATNAAMTANVVEQNGLTVLEIDDATGVEGTNYFWTVEARNQYGYSAPFTPSVQILFTNN